MMGRHLLTNLPTLGVKLRPSLPNPDVVKDTDKATKLGYEHYYNAPSQIYNQELWLSSRLTRRKAGPLKA